MRGELKKTVKYFLLPDYEQEEAYLTEMHKSGWKRKKTNGLIYTFEVCEPENVVYRLDFAKAKDRDMQSYVAMFREYGWEYIQDVNDYSYFRKNADGLSEEDTELFSDNESRLDMMKRIISTKLVPVWIVFVCILIPNFIKAITYGYGFDNIPLHTVLVVIFTLLFVWYSYVLIYCTTAFARLKKKYEKE